MTAFSRRGSDAPGAPAYRRMPDARERAKTARNALRSWGFELALIERAGEAGIRITPVERARAERDRLKARLDPHRDALVALLRREAEAARAPVAATATRAARLFSVPRTIDDLMDQLDLDRPTATRALRHLAARGHVVKLRGSGTGLWGRPAPEEAAADPAPIPVPEEMPIAV